MFEEKKMDSKMLIIPSRKKNVGEAKIQQQSFQTYLWMNNSGNDLTEKIGKLSRIFRFVLNSFILVTKKGKKFNFSWKVDELRIDGKSDALSSSASVLSRVTES